MNKTTYQHTRVIVRVDSNYSENGLSSVAQIVDLSNDVVALNTSKAVKSCGKFQLHLVPRRNYLNLVFPNDVVNIYIDPGDGERGFVRVMMGYVDRIERTETTGDDGAIQTRYVISGSDFQKAIEKTCIYFNPYLRQRLEERYFRTKTGAGKPATNIGGSALYLKGVTITGTPADFIQNFLQVLLGFGQQWQLPDTYARLQPLKDIREKRISQAKARIPSNIKKLISILGFDPEQLETNIREVISTAEQFQLNLADVKKAGTTNFGLNMARELAEQYRKWNAANILSQNSQLFAFRTLVDVSEDPNLPAGLLDLLSFDFIESFSIDGFRQDASIWQGGNQTLAQFIYGNSNGEVANELMFDLRPVNEGDGLTDRPYSREPDELGINVYGVRENGFPPSVAAIKYVPAVIFREYPYSVAESIDLSKVVLLDPVEIETMPIEISLLPTLIPKTLGGGERISTINAGIVEFGPIFAVNPDTYGRQIYKFEKLLHPVPETFPPNTQAIKHIDVVVITNDDVQQAQLGRSDEDVVNCIQLYPRIPGGEVNLWREITGNFQPMLNQISISREGLRTRELTTDFAFYQNDASDYHLPRRNLVRWALLLDHWYQHNSEYLTGTITLRGMPEIRAGYRLDWKGRSESYYVESVSHQWSYPGPLTTTVTVSRGQRNDPFPTYIPPVFLDSGLARHFMSGDRSRDGRLARSFPSKDTAATINATERGDINTEEGENILDKYTYNVLGKKDPILFDAIIAAYKNPTSVPEGSK